MHSADRRAVITFNGEIYNYRELHAELLQTGHQFATDSDTEVILHLYEEYGVDCLQQMNGHIRCLLPETGWGYGRCSTRSTKISSSLLQR